MKYCGINANNLFYNLSFIPNKSIAIQDGRIKLQIHNNLQFSSRRGCSPDIAFSYFFRPSKVGSMLHHESVWASLQQNKRNLILAKTLTLKFPSPFIIFHNKNYVFIMVFAALSFLRLIYGFFSYEQIMLVRLYA